MPATPAPIRLLVVDDDEDLRENLERRFQRQGMQVTALASGEEALGLMNNARWDVALLDLHLPGITGVELLEKLKEEQPALEVLLLTAHGSVETAIQAMKKGAYDYLSKPFNVPELEIQVEKAAEKARLHRREQQWVEQQLRYESPRYRLIGNSLALKRVREMIERVAPTDATVLVRGASGTGKELVARAIHLNSARRDRPLVTINCAALQETLLESELFGHEKGAFTGAVGAKPGLVEVAEGGTLFIDEVAEMAPALQAKLLRVLEDGHFRRVGGTQEGTADVRVVAATNRPLEGDIKSGRFREDLFYRLNVVTVDLPPLKERREDIQALVQHFLHTRPVRGGNFTVEPEAMEALVNYSWPGNVRELANVLERAQILAEGSVLTVADLPDNVVDAETSAGETPNGGDPGHLREVERRHVQEVLQREKGNKVRAARALGISRRALYRLIDRFGLGPNAKAPAKEE